METIASYAWEEKVFAIQLNLKSTCNYAHRAKVWCDCMFWFEVSFWYVGWVKGIFFIVKGRRLNRSNVDTGNTISVQNLISYSALIEVKELLQHLFCSVLTLKFTAKDTAVTMISFSPVYLVVLTWRSNMIQKRVNFGIMKVYLFTFLW